MKPSEMKKPKRIGKILGLSFAALTLAGMVVGFVIDQRNREEDRLAAETAVEEAINAEAGKVQVTLTRVAEDGMQPLEIRNDGSSPLFRMQVLFSSKERSRGGVGAGSGVNLTSDPRTEVLTCLDRYTERQFSQLDGLAPGQKIIFDLPVPVEGSDGGAVAVQFQEGNARGQWWEVLPGDVAHKIPVRTAYPEDAVCITGMVASSK